MIGLLALVAPLVFGLVLGACITLLGVFLVWLHNEPPIKASKVFTISSILFTVLGYAFVALYLSFFWPH